MAHNLMQIYSGMSYHEIGRLPYEAFLELMEVANMVNAETEKESVEMDRGGNDPESIRAFERFAGVKL